MRQYMKERYYRRRAAAIAQLGGKCVQCGSSEGLEIDHIDPEEKSYDIGRIIATHSEEKVQTELKKCQLLCKDCHLEKSKAMRFGAPEATHGTLHMYSKYKCRCSDCVTEFRRYYREYSAKRRSNKKKALAI
jgi:5-methylcytosine-specific restriction endonuclease McrA